MEQNNDPFVPGETGKRGIFDYRDFPGGDYGNELPYIREVEERSKQEKPEPFFDI